MKRAIIVCAFMGALGALAAAFSQTVSPPPPAPAPDSVAQIRSDLAAIYWRLAAFDPATKTPAPSPTPTPTPAPAPSPTPAPAPAPAPTASSFTISTAHPRLLINDAIRADLLAKIATPAGTAVWKGVIAAAEGTQDKDGNQGLCAAAVYQLWPPGFTYKLPRAQYAQLAIMQLLTPGAITSTANQSGNPFPNSLNWSMMAMAGIFDWCFDQLAADQLAQARGIITAEMIARAPDPGYNQWSGVTMPAALALATAETDAAVSDKFSNNWWSAAPPKGGYNFALAQKFYFDGGNPEGWGYSERWWHTFIATACWRTATNDVSLDALKIFDDLPWWTYFGDNPVSIGPTNWPNRHHTTDYDGDQGPTAGSSAHGCTLWACTGSANKDAAGLAAWLLANQKFYGPSAGGQALLFQLLIGDPRVAPVLPATMPLDLVHAGQGHCYFRRSTDPLDTVVYFGSAKATCRATPSNEVYVAHKGLPLLLCRKGTFDHSYAPNPFRNGVAWYASPTSIVDARTLVYDTAWSDPGHAMPGVTVNADGSLTGELVAPLWAPLATAAAQTLGVGPATVTSHRRTFKFDKAADTITLYDVAACDATKIQPHFCWNMIYEPQVNGRIVTVANGAASCTLTFDRDVGIIKVGGTATPTDWANDLFGVPSITWTGSPARTGGFVAAPSDAVRAAMGGWWRVEVVPPVAASGQFELGTVIQVQP